MADRDAQLAKAEDDITAAVAELLEAVANEFADAVADATELVAARFSVGRIARMWGNRTRGLVRRLLGTAETAAQAAAEDIDTELPPGWYDLPGRYDDNLLLPDAIGQYVQTTEHMLRAVGDRLAEVARAELAAGISAGEDIEALRARLRAAFSREGSQLGPAREERTARTEATRAWNTATLAAARAVSGPGRPVVKQWITRHDRKVRSAHDAVDGQVLLLAEPFSVAGVPMDAPGDPMAPARLVVNCRCRLAVAPEIRAAAFQSQDRPTVGISKPGEKSVIADKSLTVSDPMALHGTRGRPSYRKYHPRGRKSREGLRTLPGGGVLGSDRFSEDEHLAVLGSYNGLGYRGMNSVLRHGSESDEVSSPRHLEEVRQQIGALSDLIDLQEPTRATTTLYRGMRVPRRQTFRLAEGDEFHDKGFLSTSSDERTAQSFAGNDERSVMFTIIAPPGSRMADMNQLRDLRSTEEELILPPGSTFRVRRVVRMDLDEEDDSGPAHYELELINAVTAGGALLGPGGRPVTDLGASAEGAFQERLTWLPEQIVIDRRAKPTGRAALTAAGGDTGAMIALVPSEEDAERLALDAPDAEPAGELHLTLFYLGEGAAWSEEQRAALIAGVRSRIDDLGEPISARAFGANQWNADGDDPCWVWSVGDDPDRPRDAPRLETARWAATYALEEMHDQPDIPAQHSPWAGHVCAVYSGQSWPLDEMNARLGPIRFDRIRVAFAGEHFDIPLGPEEETPMEDDTAQPGTGLAARPWATPGDTALAFEGEETGDGRVFRPQSLYWSGNGPWPLQYADEMLMGHQGAELAGSIQSIGRDNGRITGTGVLYPGRPAGADACMLLDEGAPLGVSVDLDDVSVEFVDRTPREGDEDEGVVILASMEAASMLRMEDGSWALTATSTAEWTAAGTALSRTAASAQLITGPDGTIPENTVRAALTSGVLTAAAGDADTDTGTVVHRESSGDLVMRVTRARLRGATLVAMPAYDKARIVLDDHRGGEFSQSNDDDDLFAGSGPSPTHLRVVEFVKATPVPVGAREVAGALRIKMESARGHLSRAAKAGRLVRLARGLYVGPNDDATASDDETASILDLEASAWTAMKDLPAMPAAWFREPTADELPPGSGGVHYSDGRVYGWVAQAGEPHAGFPGKNLTIESLGKIDLTHFLRAKFALDDGTLVKTGAFTMNVPHHRDGAECESAACQFDDSRTVAGIVTVGMSKGGMWFSGAAAPWLSEWDRSVFSACQPSYHMKNSGGRWQLRAVLSVPVPGHSSPLVATAVTERSNLALAASAAGLLTAPDASGPRPDAGADESGPRPVVTDSTGPDLPGLRPDAAPDSSGRARSDSTGVDAIAASLLTSVPFLDVLLTAMDRRQEQRDAAARQEVERLAASVIDPARTELAASPTTTSTGGEA